MPTASTVMSNDGSYRQKANRLLESKSLQLQVRILIDLVALLWIGWFAWQHAGFLLRNDLYLYGDHPGQFYRLWQLLTITWQEDGWFIGWSPYWYAGWAELQFYPPGFAILGWLIWIGSFQQLSAVLVYQIVVFITFIGPAIAFYLFLAWAFPDRLAGIAAAWLSMVTPYPLGGAWGTIVGLLGDRIAFGLTPLLVLAGVWGMRNKHQIWSALAATLILAGILLSHPYQAVLPVGILGLYALFLGREWQARLRWLALVVLLGLGLTAFWWLPLALRREFFVSVIEAPLLEVRAILQNMWADEMLWLLAAALAGSLLRSKHRRWLPLAILLAGAITLGFIFFDYLVLVERLNFFALIPNRFITSVTFSLFIALALGFSELSWLGVRLLQRWNWGVLGLPLMVVTAWLIYSQAANMYDFTNWMRKWQPAPDRTPIFLSEAEARYDFPPVWELMAATPGRILFTSHYSLLFDVPTTLKAITPVLTDRPIIGGTFTTRSPVASYLWSGQTEPAVLHGKVEAQDDKTLMGVPWEAMTDDLLFDLVKRYNVTLIATTATDVNARAFLESSPSFWRIWSNQLFTFYQPIDYEPAWVEADLAIATVSRYERRAIDVQISEAAAGATLLVKVAHYDLWAAEADNRSLPILRDEYGLMKIPLPPGSYTVQLRYQPGWPEWLGGIISLATLAGALAIFFSLSRRRTATD